LLEPKEGEHTNHGKPVKCTIPGYVIVTTTEDSTTRVRTIHTKEFVQYQAVCNIS